MKHLLLLLALPFVLSMTSDKPQVLDWQLIYQTAWDEKSDETNSTSVWIPEFGAKLVSLEGKQVSVTGYISRDKQGRFILTQVRRSPDSRKDRSKEPPDYIVLEAFSESVYFAPFKRYELQGLLDLHGDDSSRPPFLLRESYLIRE